MHKSIWVGLFIALGMAVLALVYLPGPVARAAESTYQAVEWAQVPGDWQWGPVPSVAFDNKGTVYALRRSEPVLVSFDMAGKFLKAVNQNMMYVWTHGLRVDRNGFLWTTDGQGHMVYKHSPDGKVLMSLGQKNVPGDNDSPDKFNRPTDVVVAENGDFFVSDGYVNSRVVKFSKDGKFIKKWGTNGTDPGQFNLPHAIVMDSKGRLIVGDYRNKRIQIFDQDGKFIDQWTQFGAPAGLYIAADDMLYVVDEGGNTVSVGSAKDGKVTDRITGLATPHWVTVDSKGAIYVSELRGATVKKFVKK